MKVVETNMADGIDLVHEFFSIEDAIKSERFDYIKENFGKKEWRNILRKSKTIEDFIKNVGYPFYAMK